MISRSILEMLCSCCVSSFDGMSSSSLGGLLERVVRFSRFSLAAGLYIVLVVVFGCWGRWMRGMLAV